MLVALVMLALVGAVLAVTKAPAASGQTVIHVVYPIETVRFLDFGNEGLQIGDRVVAHGALLDSASDDPIGTAYQECVVQRRITENTGLWVCAYVLQLEGGEIMLTGLDPRGPGSSSFAVTGGTGAYSSAEGTGAFTDTETVTDMVITLTV